MCYFGTGTVALFIHKTHMYNMVTHYCWAVLYLVPYKSIIQITDTCSFQTALLILPTDLIHIVCETQSLTC